MPEMDLRQSRFRYSASRPFTKKKQKKGKKRKRENKNLKIRKIQDIFIKTN